MDIEKIGTSLLVLALSFKNKETGEHSKSVQRYSLMIAKELNLSKEEMEIIECASILHDIGKIGIPDSILEKSSSLSDEEYDKIKEHPIYGEEMSEPFLPKIRKIIRQHHERFDGKGYPDGLKGKEIEIGARILAVADSFDAMVSDRPYRKGIDRNIAMEEIVRNSSTQFDPEVASILQNLNFF